MNLRIKEVMKEKGMSQVELSRLLGLGRSTISLTLKGGNPNIETLAKIAKALGVPVSYLIDEPQEGFLRCPHCGKYIIIEAKKPEQPKARKPRAKKTPIK